MGAPGARAAAMLLFLLPAAGAGQQPAEDWCRDVGNAQYCEVRQLLAPITTGELAIDVGANGSIRVEGYSGSDVRVVARVTARSRNEAGAEDLAGQVEVRLEDGRLRATGPRTTGRSGWSVSVRVRVPEGTAIDARTTNGSVVIGATNAPVRAQTTNGSITLTDVARRVDARSTNGTIRAEVAATAAALEAIQLRTTNGSIRLALPERTSASLQLNTTNGSLVTDLPVQVQGRVNRRQLSGVIGDGGPEIRASTTNGSIRITKR